MPGTPTTKYAIPTIAGADLISGIDDWSVSAMGALDGLLAPSDQGTLAFRPVSTIPSPSGKAGRTYYATDTNQFFRDTGTGWTELVVAGATPPALGVPAQQAWQSLALGAGAAGTIYYYKDSLGWVHVRSDENICGTGTGWGAAATLATFPAGYRPLTQPGGGQGFIILVGAAAYRVTVQSTGELRASGATSASQSVSGFGALGWLAEN